MNGENRVEGVVGGRYRRWYNSKTGLTALLLVAISLSVIALISESRQGYSYFWTVEEDLIVCEIARPPWQFFRRTLKYENIVRIETVPHAEDPDAEMLSVFFDTLTFNVPDQNSRTVPNFDAYVRGLEGFLQSVQAGHLDSRFAHRHPGYVGMLAAAIAAVICWIALFFIVLTRPRKHGAGSGDGTAP